MAGWLDGNWSVDWSTRFLIIGQLCLSDLLIKEFSNPHYPIVEKVILFHYLPLPTEFPTFVKTGYLLEFMEKKMCTITSKYLQISAQRKVVFCWSPHQPKCQTVRSPFIFLQQYFLNLIKVFVKSDQKYFSIWSTGCAHMLGNHSPDQLICPQGAASDCSRVTHADQPLHLSPSTSCI